MEREINFLLDKDQALRRLDRQEQEDPSGCFLFHSFSFSHFLSGCSEQSDNQNKAMITNPVVELRTNQGMITIELFQDETPLAASNFLKLVKDGFYDNTKFHRVIKGFMIQGGDPNSKDDDWSNDGIGGPGYTFADEVSKHKLVRGVVAMANAGPNTNGSQFFIITTAATPWLDGKHTAFGVVVDGMEVVDKIEKAQVNDNDHPVEDITVVKAVVR
ncbi:MAG: peptidylprolyl isomerase [bacterium]